jgi:hypothetical protein
MLLFIFNFYSLLSCGQLVIYEAFVFASQKPGLLPTHLYFLVSPWKCCHLGLQSSQKKRNSERSNFVNFVVPALSPNNQFGDDFEDCIVGSPRPPKLHLPGTSPWPP